MAQPITDYAAFFAGAKQAVKELEELKQRERELEDSEKELERTLQAKQRAVADAISQTVKQRTDEITGSYDEEIGRTQDRMKKVRAKREKAKDQGVRERIEEDTQSLVKENRELRGQMKTLFQNNHVPGFCRSGYYYSLYFPRGLREAGALLLTLLICFLVFPCGIYFLLPERRSFYLIGIYLAAILIFGGLYVLVGNKTKLRHLDTLKEGRAIRNKILTNEKRIRFIAKTIRKDKNEAGYNLEKYDDELAQLEQDVAQIVKKKRDALDTFENVTRSIISDEILGNSREELDRLENQLTETAGELKIAQNRIKEKSLEITDEYEVYVGRDFLTADRLEGLAQIIREGTASNISEAISIFKSRTYGDAAAGFGEIQKTGPVTPQGKNGAGD